MWVYSRCICLLFLTNLKNLLMLCIDQIKCRVQQVVHFEMPFSTLYHSVAIFCYTCVLLNLLKVIQFCPQHCRDSGCEYILFCVNSTYCVQCLVDRDSSSAAVFEVTAAITVLSPSLKSHLKVVQGFNAIEIDLPDSVCIAHWLFFMIFFV